MFSNLLHYKTEVFLDEIIQGETLGFIIWAREKVKICQWICFLDKTVSTLPLINFQSEWPILILLDIMKFNKKIKYVGLAFLLVSLFLLNACHNDADKKIVRNKAPLAKWLGKPDNFEAKIYRDTFTTNYKTYIANGKIDLAADLLEAFGNTLDLRFEYDSFFVNQCKTFVEKHEIQLGIYHRVALNYFLGSQYDFGSKKDSSVFYLQKAYIIETDDIDALQLKGFAGILIGNQYAQKGLLDQALLQSLQNLKLFETIKDTINQATTYSSISDIYMHMKVYDESDKYNSKAIDLSISVKDTQNILIGYINAARPNSLEIKPDTIMVYSIKAKALYDAWSRKADFYGGNVNYGYGQALLLNNQLDSVEHYFNIAEKLSQGNRLLQYDLISANCMLDEKLNRPIRNITEVEELLQLAKEQKDQIFIESLSGSLAEDAYKKGNYKKAYEYIQTKYSTRDSSWTVQTRADITELDKKYQTAKKEKQIAVQKSKLEKSKFQITSLMFSLIGLVLGTIIFFGYRKRKEAQAEVIRQQNFTDELLQNTEVERKRIATDLHDSVSHELMSLKTTASEGFGLVNSKIDTIINDIRIISRNLHPIMFDKVGLQNTVEQMVERVQLQNNFMLTSDFNYENSLSSAKELQLYRILQEAITNMVKYSKAIAGKIIIKENLSEIQVEIKDNGIGFNVQEKLNSNQSFGLHNIIERSRAIGGKATILSDANGTIINISILKKQV